MDDYASLTTEKMQIMLRIFTNQIKITAQTRENVSDVTFPLASVPMSQCSLSFRICFIFHEKLKPIPGVYFSFSKNGHQLQRLVLETEIYVV